MLLSAAKQFLIKGYEFSTVKEIADLAGLTETTLQLYLTESSEHIRELYAAAYSLPRTTEIIQHTITDKLEVRLKNQQKRSCIL